jgi:hypothetical protein
MSDSIITNTPNLYSSAANGIYATGNGTSTNGNDVSGWFKWFFFNRYMLIAIILAYLGFNLFSYFGSLLKVVMDIIRPLISILGYTTGETAKEVVKVAKVGSKGVIDVAAGVTTGGINVLEKGLTGSSKKTNNGTSAASAVATKPPKAAFPIPDDAGSRTQANKAKSKSGYCYIGEDRGFRSCIQVNDSDTCMSGDIFPTQEICINPSLRQ